MNLAVVSYLEHYRYLERGFVNTSLKMRTDSLVDDDTNMRAAQGIIDTHHHIFDST